MPTREDITTTLDATTSTTTRDQTNFSFDWRNVPGMIQPVQDQIKCGYNLKADKWK